MILKHYICIPNMNKNCLIHTGDLIYREEYVSPKPSYTPNFLTVLQITKHGKKKKLVLELSQTTPNIMVQYDSLMLTNR